MAYRGRLLFPNVAEIARLDTSAIETASGYDHDFRTIKHSYPSGPAGTRVSTRKELPSVMLRCQVEMGRWEAQRMTPTGNSPDSEIILVFHFEELEAKGLVDADGAAKIRVNDRLVSLRRLRDNQPVTLANKPAGLFVTEAQPAGFGLGGDRNLLVVTLGDRPQGLVAAS